MAEKKDRYFKVYEWMSEDTGLSGNRLLVYALVSSLQGEDGFYGSLSFISKLTGCSRENICRMLARMVKDGILRKVETTSNGKKTVRYEALIKRQGCCQNVNDPLTKRQRTIDETSTVNNKEIKEEIKENIITKEKDGLNSENSRAYTDEFLEVFRVLGKGSKNRAWDLWQQLSDEEIGKVKEHVGHYVAETARKYRFGLERYLRERTYEDPVYYDGAERNVKRFDPQKEKRRYEPGGDVVTDERGNHYLNYVWRRGVNIIDGYSDEDRPDGVVLNMYGDWENAVRWNGTEKKWEMI